MTSCSPLPVLPELRRGSLWPSGQSQVLGPDSRSCGGRCAGAGATPDGHRGGVQNWAFRRFQNPIRSLTKSKGSRRYPWPAFPLRSAGRGCLREKAGPRCGGRKRSASASFGVRTGVEIGARECPPGRVATTVRGNAPVNPDLR